MEDSTEIQELAAMMRKDWNQRAIEDVGFYVAFYRRDQPEDAFHNSAEEIVKEVYPEISRLRTESPPGAFIRALEIGCGPGRLMLPMSRHVDEIHGVDISEEMISLAARRLQHLPHAHVQVNSGYDLSGFPNEHFSLVYSYIVFQHIPSREIVLKYLLETKRVLAPGGVTRFQVRGASPSFASQMDSATWKGCVITDEEIVDFARRNYMELVALSGEGTQYLWVTLKKPAAHSPGPTLEAVTAAHDGESIVPQRGRHSGLSLWVRNASEGSDLTSLTAKINGAPVRGCYLSPIGSNGGCQMNVMLPQDVSPGMAEVALLDRGVVSGTPKTIYIEAVHLVPRVTAIYDAVNTTLLMQSDSGGLKVLMEDLTAQETIRFRLADHPITGVDLVCTNRILGQFLFSLLLPPSISGAVKLSVLIEDHEVFGGTVEISTPQVAAENAAAETQEPKVIDPDAPRNQPSS